MKILPELYNILIFVAVIFFGAVVHATSQLKIARDKKAEFNKTDFLILFTLACFSGFVFGFLSREVFESQNMVILCTAIGAFLGMAGLNRVSAIVLELLTRKNDKQD